MSAQSTPMKKVASASFVGALLEWYDFFLYGTAAALVLNQLFFPDLDPMIGVMAAFASHAAGFLARPIGGIVFGHFGDKIGRKKILVITMLMMGGATFIIGLLPTYAVIGVWAPVLLVTMRLLQGFALGGEYGGASLLVIEHSPRKKRGFWGAFLQSATPLGLLLASGVFALISLLPEEQFMAWGWRVPFLISVILLVVGTFIRLKISETPAFKEMKESKEEVKVPLFEVLKNYPRNVSIALGARLAETVSFNIFNVFVISYVSTHLGLPYSVALTGTFLASGVAIFASPLFGALSDRIGRKPVYLMGSIFTLVFAFPFFSMLNTETEFIIYLAAVLAYVFGTTMMFGIQSVFFSEMFGTNVRYSGLSFVYQLGGILGGFTPLVATYLLTENNGNHYFVALFLAIVSAISIVCTLLAKETYKVDKSEFEKSINDKKTIQDKQLKA
ncbi:MHS family MFS transporter [Bacillus haikouensis]|jgi:MFS transporter, MHS family, shikimate and dehydroshikimate transport protein|uniref:MFS transporter n=1 Tax=Bacillus haikouensis TaxID=1510468 RepID=UPI0015535698|nr:MFS transporter [Bacillus haikouensis]NQD64329.1 MHS family MFS transporter [Bacillus haikouensis]